MFDKDKDMLASAATLAFPDGTATTFLFTVASDVGRDQSEKNTTSRCRSQTNSTSSLSVRAARSQQPVNLGGPIVIAYDKLACLLLRPQGVKLFCDHRNLIHVFAPDESVKKHMKGMLLRGVMKRMNYTCVIKHIAYPQNVWAAMISRWAGDSRPGRHRHQVRPCRDAECYEFEREMTETAGPEVTETIVLTLRPLDDANIL